MNLDYLKSFIVTAKSGSISKAAKKLHLTQPGLSMQIQSLESMLETQLLKRSNKGVELTEEGELLFEHASNMISLENSIYKNIKELKSKNNILSIASCNCLGAYIIPCSIYTFKGTYPDLKVSLEVCRSNKVIERLLNHQSNIGILTSQHKTPGILTIPIMEDNLVLVTNPSTEYNEISLEELRSIPLILQSQDSSLNKILISSLSNYKLSSQDLNIILTMNSSESIKSTLSSGPGFAFLPEVTVRKELKSKTLKKISLPALDTSFNYYFAYREDHIFTSYEERFKKYLLSKNRFFCT